MLQNTLIRSLKMLRWLPLLAVLLAACAPMTGTGALLSPASVSPEAGHLQIVGTVEKVEGSAVTLGSATFALAADAGLSPDLAVGQTVELQAALNPEGGLTLLEVSPVAGADVASGGLFELIGVVERQSPEAWLISGQIVQLTPATEITGDPRIGDRVKAQGRIVEGALVAREIRALRPELTRTPEATGQAEFEFRGQVKEMHERVWVIGEYRVHITERTEIKGDPRIGDWVKVHALRTEDGLIAREIEVIERTRTPEPTRPPEIEFRGQLTAIEGRVWVIGEYRVIVTERTEIKGEPRIGDWLKVHALRTEDGLVAREIELLEREATRTPEPTREVEPTRPPEATRTPEPSRTPEPTRTVAPAEIEFVGTLNSKEGGVWNVGGTSVMVTGETEIRDNPQVGDTVKVHGWLQADGVVKAREIRKQ
jgi:hypothetical protein